MFDDFTTQIQSDELAAREGMDWVNDYEEEDDDEGVIDD